MAVSAKSSTFASRMKKILLINDVVGYSHVGMVAMMPILTYLGHPTYNLPTSLVSNTLDYGQFNVLDTTEYMRGVLPVWRNLGFTFDAVCTGLMFSEEQAQLVSAYCTELARQGTTIFVDPIMGDDGRLYNGITQRSVELMRQMVSVADLTFPNFTEACYLTSTPYHAEGMSWEDARELLSRLRDIGCRSALVTSAKVEGQSCVIGYNHFNGEFFRLDYDEIPVLIHGTGDIFSAVLIGHLLKGEQLKQSTRTAMDVVSRLIERNRDLDDKKRGIPIEKCLDLL